jgi:hypothetical protein
MMPGTFIAASVMEIPAKTSLNTLFTQRMDEQRKNRPCDGHDPDLLNFTEQELKLYNMVY